MSVREYTEEEIRDGMHNIEEDSKEVLQFLTQCMFVQYRVTTDEDPDLHKQMTAKAGIKKFREAAVRALVVEFEQLDRLNAFKLVDPNILNNDQKLRALRAIDLIKLKRYEKIKGRTVVDESPQRTHYERKKRCTDQPQ